VRVGDVDLPPTLRQELIDRLRAKLSGGSHRSNLSSTPPVGVQFHVPTGAERITTRSQLASCTPVLVPSPSARARCSPGSLLPSLRQELIDQLRAKLFGGSHRSNLSSTPPEGVEYHVATGVERITIRSQLASCTHVLVPSP